MIEVEERILKYGSPIFSYKLPALGVNENFILDYHTQIPATGKYLPFNFCLITNNSEGDIEVWFDDFREYSKTIPKNTIMSFENLWFRRLRIVNISNSSLSANRIEITAQRLPVKDEIARMPDLPLIQKIKLLLGI